MESSYHVHAYKGYFVGSFCAETGESLYVGFAQICTERPTGSADAQPLEQVRSIGAYPDRDKALNAAQHQARAIIDSLTPHWDPFTAPGWMVSR
ncbi:MAG TPA: hypothetical protein VMZ74_15600 [Ramlibacter sp.]|nr:hypothetical protein [Ramlibacter sp.]